VNFLSSTPTDRLSSVIKSERAFQSPRADRNTTDHNVRPVVMPKRRTASGCQISDEVMGQRSQHWHSSPLLCHLHAIFPSAEISYHILCPPARSPYLIFFYNFPISFAHQSFSIPISPWESTMSSNIDYEKVVPAMLELTDSIIKLLDNTSHREIHVKSIINGLRALIIRERKTIHRQGKVIIELKKQLAEVEEQLNVLQNRLRNRVDTDWHSGDSIRIKDEDVDYHVNDDSSPEEDDDVGSPNSAAEVTTATLYGLQSIYIQIAERYASGLKVDDKMKSECSEDT
ncbi:hypothetical protein D6D20_04014, partial [Aureobasidium pullulans]